MAASMTRLENVWYSFSKLLFRASVDSLYVLQSVKLVCKKRKIVSKRYQSCCSFNIWPLLYWHQARVNCFSSHLRTHGWVMLTRASFCHLSIDCSQNRLFFVSQPEHEKHNSVTSFVKCLKLVAYKWPSAQCADDLLGWSYAPIFASSSRSLSSK